MADHRGDNALSRRRLLRTFGVAAASAAALPLISACAGQQASPTAAPKAAATTAPAAATTAPAAATKPAATTAPAAASPAATTAAAASPAATKPAAAASPAATTAAAATPAAKPAALGPATIAIATSWTGTGEAKIWEQLIESYRKKYPNVEVKLDLSSAEGAYDQKLFAQLAAGTLPDVVLTSDNHVVPFKQNKITQDMIPWARKTNFPYTDFDKTFLDLGIVEGELHMLPRGGDVVILFINKRMVQEAGVEIPWKLDVNGADANKWTWDEFIKVCQKLSVDASGKRGDDPAFDKKNIAVYGAAVPSSWWAVYVPAVLAHGGQFVSPDLSKSMLDSKEAVAAFDALTKPVLDGIWAPTSFLTTLGGNGPAWTSGKAAITMTVRAGIPGLRPNIKDDWDVAHYPKGPAKRVTGMGTFGFALSASTKYGDQAWAFLDHMYGEEGMKIIASNYGSVPAQRRFYKASFWRDLPPPPANNDVFTDAFSYGTLPPRLPFYTTGPFSKAIEDGLQGIELGKMTPEQAVKGMHDELSKWLSANPQKKP
jgi:multiple sugar transport system substrate-binding protein